MWRSGKQGRKLLLARGVPRGVETVQRGQQALQILSQEAYSLGACMMYSGGGGGWAMAVMGYVKGLKFSYMQGEKSLFKNIGGYGIPLKYNYNILNRNLE